MGKQVKESIIYRINKECLTQNSIDYYYLNELAKKHHYLRHWQKTVKAGRSLGMTDSLINKWVNNLKNRNYQPSDIRIPLDYENLVMNQLKENDLHQLGRVWLNMAYNKVKRYPVEEYKNILNKKSLETILKS